MAERKEEKQREKSVSSPKKQSISIAGEAFVDLPRRIERPKNRLLAAD
jgi:hypothetical protein